MPLSVTEVHGSRVVSTAAVYLQSKPLPQIFAGNLLLGTLLGQESRANKMTFPLKVGRVRRQTGGREVRIRLRYNRSTNVTSFKHLDELTTNLDDIDTICRANWSYYTDLAGQSWQEAIENDGEAEEYDLFQNRLDNVIDTVKERVDTDLMATGDGVSVGNEGKNVIGLNSLFPADPTSGTVWGLDRGVAGYSWWRPNLVTAGTTFASGGTTNLALAHVTQSGTSGEDPMTFAITTSAQWRAYHAIVAALQSVYTMPVAQDKTGDTGFETLQFMNRPVVYHSGQTANVWMTLNLNYLVVFLQNKAQFNLLNFKGDAKQLIDILSRVVFGLQVGAERFDRHSRILFTG